MAEKYLIVVDVQNDFVTDALGTLEAEAAAPAIIEKAKNFDGSVVFTQDTHPENYMDTQEGELLPVPHCIKGTNGWKLIPELAALQKEKNLPVYEKPTFGSVRLAQDLAEKDKAEGVESVELIGLCTDICVLSNALLIKAFLPEVPIYVDAACCAGVTPEKHRAALLSMESCQIRLKNQEA